MLCWGRYRVHEGHQEDTDEYQEARKRKVEWALSILEIARDEMKQKLRHDINDLG